MNTSIQNEILTREKLHQIGASRLQHYDKWQTQKPEKMSLKKLKQSVEWWREELILDCERSKMISPDDSITYVASTGNIAQTAMLYGVVESHYIKKLEKEFQKIKSKQKSNKK